MIKKYNEFITEGLLAAMKPKSKEEIVGGNTIKSVFSYAKENDDTDIMKILVTDRGMSINIVMDYAAETDNLELIKWTMDNGGSVYANDKRTTKVAKGYGSRNVYNFLRKCYNDSIELSLKQFKAEREGR